MIMPKGRNIDITCGMNFPVFYLIHTDVHCIGVTLLSKLAYPIIYLFMKFVPFFLHIYYLLPLYFLCLIIFYHHIFFSILSLTIIFSNIIIGKSFSTITFFWYFIYYHVIFYHHIFFVLSFSAIIFSLAYISFL